MNGIVEFFCEYGWIAFAVTVLASAAGVIFGAVAKNKPSRGLKDVIATITAILLEIIAEMIFVKKAFTFDANALYTGIICGSLAAAISAFILKIAEGRVTAKDVTDFVTELLEGFLDGERKAEAAKAIVKAAKTQNEDMLTETVERLLATGSSPTISEEEARKIAKSVIKLIKSFKTTG